MYFSSRREFAGFQASFAIKFFQKIKLSQMILKFIFWRDVTAVILMLGGTQYSLFSHSVSAQRACSGFQLLKQQRRAVHGRSTAAQVVDQRPLEFVLQWTKIQFMQENRITKITLISYLVTCWLTWRSRGGQGTGSAWSWMVGHLGWLGSSGWRHLHPLHGHRELWPEWHEVRVFSPPNVYHWPIWVHPGSWATLLELLPWASGCEKEHQEAPKNLGTPQDTP